MKRKLLKAVAASAMLLLVAVVSVAVFRPRSKQVEKPPARVKVVAVEMNSAERGARYSATIIPRTEAELAFKVGGYVDAIQQVRGADGRTRDLQEGGRSSADTRSPERLSGQSQRGCIVLNARMKVAKS